MIELTKEMVLNPHFIASDYRNKILIILCYTKSDNKIDYSLITQQGFECGMFINRCFCGLTKGNNLTAFHAYNLLDLIKKVVKEENKWYSYKLLAFDNFTEMCIYFAES